MKYSKEKTTVSSAVKTEYGYSVNTEQCICYAVESRYLKGKGIKPGDEIDLYTIQGSRIIGMDLNGHNLFLLTQEELDAEDAAFRQDFEKKKAQRFLEQKENLDARFEAFPKLLQHRIAMYRKFDQNFRQDEEEYEGLAMLLGYQIFLACKTEQEIKRFRLLDPTQRRQIVPMLSNSGISFNQLDFAYYFAVMLAKDVASMDIYNPTHADLLNSEVMLLPNALAPLTGMRCKNRPGYIRRYLDEM